MTGIVNTPARPRPSAKLAVWLAISAVVAVGTFAGAARADDHRWDNRWHGGWGGGYYRAPPVVWGAPAYPYRYGPPPVVYGPGIGINLPGVNIGIR